MSPRYWLEFRIRKIVLFTLVIVAIGIFWSILPAETRASAFRGSRRGLPSLPILMFGGWMGGWFLLLFVRAEDLHITVPFDYQALCRVVALMMICAALLIAGFFALSFLA